MSDAEKLAYKLYAAWFVTYYGTLAKLDGWSDLSDALKETWLNVANIAREETKPATPRTRRTPATKAATDKPATPEQPTEQTTE